MEAPKDTARRGPIFYAGRHVESGASPPDGAPVLGDWDVLPARLAAEVEGATALVVADLFSFPFEALTASLKDVPLVLIPPPGHDEEFLSAVFGEAAFARLGLFDRVATPDSGLWKALARRYGLSERQRIVTKNAGPAAMGEVAAVLAGSGEAASGKAAYRAQRTVLGPRFVAARGARAADVPFDVLEVGSGEGLWAASFDPANTRFFGLEWDGEAVDEARVAFPYASFQHLGPDETFPHDDESFDLVFTVGVTSSLPVPAKRDVISEMWRVARPGGRLVFLEDFVATKHDAPVVSVQAFVVLLVEATGGQAVMEYVESLRYPGEDFVRGGVLDVTRLGVPKRW